MQKNAFYRVTSLITVADFQEKLGCTVYASELATTAAQYFFGNGEKNVDPDTICLVAQDNCIVGSWSPLDVDWEEDFLVSDHMTPLDHNRLVSANTTYFEMADIFASKEPYFYFVLDGTEIVGFVSYNSMQSRICQLCLFALLMDLESAIEYFLLFNPQVNWNLLSEGRREKSIQCCIRKFKIDRNNLHNSDYRNLIKSTMFIDKGTMLQKGNAIKSLDKKSFLDLF